ncbi:CBS domain-containing protein [Bacillus salacetis]|uniref:CBS domain-containing protein n=1 Tax=Bacillus salacetis TaxID=2315464 RepID=A0A3A1QM26_9BACI|nr:CBS domain-containing protein [Bacillus salacetis]RIW27458.1 CBS domain-containing protein [Bacillus salacetis]
MIWRETKLKWSEAGVIVKEIMTRNVETCTLLDNVYEVAVKMKENDVGAIPIVDGEHLIGMITDRDLVIRGIAEKHPGSSKVETVMSDELVTIGSEASAVEAADLMSRHQIRRLPVVDGQKLIGIVSLGDLALRDKLDHQTNQAIEKISEHEIGANKPI